jgi:hypothetical protein
VRREAAWLRERGSEAAFFCGGGWFIDEHVARAVAEAGYVDCTATAFRPRYLEPGAPRLAARRPLWLTHVGWRLLELPTTHSIGMAARAALDPQPLGELVHVYFHDADLLSPVRRRTLTMALRILARRTEPLDLAELADRASASAHERPFSEVAEP